MKIKDDSIMTFGKYQGSKMSDLPADYLLWLGGVIQIKYFKNRSLQEKTILEYITNNKRVLLIQSLYNLGNENEL